jgi:hypothetical protein
VEIQDRPVPALAATRKAAQEYFDALSSALAQAKQAMEDYGGRAN